VGQRFREARGTAARATHKTLLGTPLGMGAVRPKDPFRLQPLEKWTVHRDRERALPANEQDMVRSDSSSPIATNVIFFLI